ncbi:MAG: CBS domain-containing protein [Saprospiraceae bacterium]|jgi:CBS domain-containing protein|nr:CBS domain-containing protein [Saprospiraceae bacterium]
MKRREPVSHIMTKNVHTVSHSDSLKEVANVFKDGNIHHLPVKKGNEIVGIISSNDINRLTFGKLYDHQEGIENAVLDTLSIDQVMTHNPLTVNAEDSIKEVAEVFANAKFHAMPVVENSQLVGIVTTTDLIKYMLEQY